MFFDITKNMMDHDGIATDGLASPGRAGRFASRLRLAIFCVAGALIVALPVMLLFGTPTSSAEYDPDPGPSPVLLVVGVAFALALLWATLSLLREPRRFLRLATGLTTVALGLTLATVVWVAIAFATGDGSVSVGGPIKVGVDGSIDVDLDSRISMSSSDDRVARSEQQWLLHGYGRGSQFAQSTHVEFGVAHPSGRTRLLAWLNVVINLAPYMAMLWLLRGVFARSARGAPFAAANVKALRWIAGLLVIDWLRVALLEPATAFSAIRDNGGHASFPWVFHGSTLLEALLVLALAEVWRYGIELQREAEVTI